MNDDIKYIILEKHDILNGIKYKIGKRYKLDKFNGVEIYRNISDINFLDSSLKWSIEDVDIYKIKAYHTFMSILITEKTKSILCTSDFKILKKLNYKEMNIEKENSEIIFGFKNRDEKILDKILKFAKEDCYKSGFQLASLGIEKYLKELRKINRNDAWLAWLTLNRNKDLDKLAKSRYAVEKIAVAQVGRPQDLDILINDNDEDVVRTVLSNGRKKDLEKYIKNPTQEIKEGIFEAGIDKYLDVLVKNTKDDLTGAPILRCVLNHGRKKDIEKFKNSIYNKDLIKDFTDDDILKLR